jgi:hypothetical protein
MLHQSFSSLRDVSYRGWLQHLPNWSVGGHNLNAVDDDDDDDDDLLRYHTIGTY